MAEISYSLVKYEEKMKSVLTDIMHCIRQAMRNLAS